MARPEPGSAPARSAAAEPPSPMESTEPERSGSRPEEEEEEEEEDEEEEEEDEGALLPPEQPLAAVRVRRAVAEGQRPPPRALGLLRRASTGLS